MGRECLPTAREERQRAASDVITHSCHLPRRRRLSCGRAWNSQSPTHLGYQVTPFCHGEYLMRHRHDAVVERVGTTLHVRMDDITHEPMPRRWVELIHYLDKQEGMQSERLHRETSGAHGPAAKD